MKFLDAKTDIAFKKLFGDQKGTDRTISFLNNILELQEGELITSVKIENTENLPLSKGKKKSFIDVRCTDQANKKYLVEMQRVDEHDFLERAGFYSSLSIHSQLKKNEPYTTIAPVIFVGVLDFDLFAFDHYLSHHSFMDAKTKERTLRHSEFHFIELDKFNKPLDDCKKDLDKWIYLIKNSDELKAIPPQLKSIQEIRDALETLNEATWTEKERLEYLAELDVERGKKSTEEWERKQLAAAEEKGKIEGKIEVAKRLLMKEMTITDVAEATGLTIGEIKKLK